MDMDICLPVLLKVKSTWKHLTIFLSKSILVSCVVLKNLNEMLHLLICFDSHTQLYNKIFKLHKFMLINFNLLPTSQRVCMTTACVDIKEAKAKYPMFIDRAVHMNIVRQQQLITKMAAGLESGRGNPGLALG